MAGRVANGVSIGTRIGAFIGIILCVLYAGVSPVQVPGMGLNVFFAYTVMLGMDYTYGQALVAMFISGVFFVVITATGLREAIIRSIPDAAETAITPGIGLLITTIGLKNMGIVISSLAALVSLVDFSQQKIEGVDPTLMSSVLVTLAGLVIVGMLHIGKAKGSVFLGIMAATPIGILLGVTHVSNLDMDIGMKFRNPAEVSLTKMGSARLFSGASMVETIFAATMLVISPSPVNVSDSISILLGAAKQSGTINENDEVIRMKRTLMSGAISTTTDAMVGILIVTTVVESSTGIAAGGRTGLTGLVIVLMFLGAILFAPIVSIAPAAAAVPVLILMGTLMLGNIGDVDFSDTSNAFPAFRTIISTSLTYLIVNGAVFGLIIYCLMKSTIGRRQGAKVLALAISVVLVARYTSMTLG